jgi:TolB-like protein/DNA-binding SARP family transcriptional activator/Flp pilus assembly protein TadD
MALLALLALAPAQRLSRDKLLGYLWPESDPERGRNLLKVATYVLRSALGDGAVLSEGDDLRLDPAVISTDALEFDAALARRDFARAVALYRGPFLDGFFLNDAPDFEQWASRERERLGRGYASGLEALATECENRRDHPRAAEWWKRRSALDPYDTRVAARLMLALDAAGNPAAALQHASVHERLLKEEFGIPLPSEIAAIAERLWAKTDSGYRIHEAGRIHENAQRRADVGYRPGVVTETVEVPHRPPESRNPIPDTGHPVSDIRHPISDVRHPSSDIRHPIADSPHPISDIRHPIADSRYPIADSRGRQRLKWGSALVVLAAVAGGAIWSARPSGADSERAIAVLPFVNIGGDSVNEYFSDGLTEEIITNLAGVPHLKVISRTSAMHYKGSRLPLREIATALGVAHVLEGSVRRSGDRVRISAQLIDAGSDVHLWAQSYDTDFKDIVRVQGQIAREVARALELGLGDRDATDFPRRGTSDVVAYEYYRRGRYLWDTRTKVAHERALEYFNMAIARDSSYADAYAGIADVYTTLLQLNLTQLSEAEVFARKKWAAERALALDERSADAHVAYATTLMWVPDWPGCERGLRRALELNPNHATGHTWYALILAGMGRLDEALEQSRRAFELDPFAVIASSNYGWLCYLKGDTDCALTQERRVLEISPMWGRAYSRMAMVYAHTGKLDSALLAVRKAIELTPERPDFSADLAYILALRGDTAGARSALRRVKPDPFEPFNVARAYIGLGELDSAFVWLDRANWKWPHRAVRSDPSLDPIRSDPRFVRLSSRIDSLMGMR